MHLPLSILVLVAAILVWNHSDAWHLEFVYLPLNDWLDIALIMSIPVLIFWAASKVLRRAYRICGIVVSVVFAIPCLFLAMLVSIDSPGFKLLSDGQVRTGHFRLYRTNCGATCAYGLDLRKEYDIVPGLKVVARVWSRYRESEGRIVVDDALTVHVLSGSIELVAVQD